ncbi:Uncharacterised protein [uncultured archaeon]|nr:Uncharacterised protein [uncultured archaeon]
MEKMNVGYYIPNSINLIFVMKSILMLLKSYSACNKVVTVNLLVTVIFFILSSITILPIGKVTFSCIIFDRNF